MPQDEIHRLGEARRLIFQNVAVGLPVEQVAATFKVSREEVLRDVAHVARKIREYRFQRRLPPVASDTMVEIRANRKFLLASLGNIGSNQLASSLILPRLTVQTLKTGSDVKEAMADTHSGNSAR